MAMTGWIKIHRDIQRHWIAQDIEKLGRWIDLLLLASHKDSKVLVGDTLVSLKRGQMVMSFSFLAERWKISKSTASKFIELLESDTMVERSTERNVTILTICNYNSYQQHKEGASNDNRTQCRTDAERLPNENKNVEEYNINYNNNSAHAHEEIVEWDDVRENGFLERFKAQGSAKDAMRMTGKKLSAVMSLLDAYRAKRRLQNRGHADFNQFCNLFAWYLENGKIPQSNTPIENKPKVLSGQALLDSIK